MKQYIGNNCLVEILPFEKSKENLVQEKITSKTAIDSENIEDAFFIGDLGDIIHKHRKWQKTLPRVTPFYAVKCNDDHAVLKTMVDLGLSFDCASKAEIQKVLKFDISPSRIVYANPCKQTSYLKYAASKNVSMMTFDNEDELHKVKAVYPTAELIIRILPPADFKVQCELGCKFGCPPKKARQLLEAAKKLELNVVGVSYHVGSGCEEADAFRVATQQAREVFDIGLELGFNMRLLDIGGGFPGDSQAAITFDEIAEVLNLALDQYFPEDEGVRIIAEPGRFYVSSAFTLAVNIIAKRIVARDQDGKERDLAAGLTSNDEPSFMYYVNDGVYGSFNCLLFDHATVYPSLVKDQDDEMLFSSSVWGPTCDGLDCINKECQLPELQIGEWIFFKNMGAYTLAAASTFNGMPPPKRNYYCLADVWETLYPDFHAKKDNRKKKVLPVKIQSGHNVTETGSILDDITGSSPADGLCVGPGFGLDI